MATISDDQQFCLRWNNFQANITSQFEALRDDEDFTDVTIACDGQRLQAHKVVLSACSPFFKDLFKSNPCSHPIIFMRDVEVRHVTALLEFMYAGEVNVAQAHLSDFLKTAESLRIRGLTDTSSSETNCQRELEETNTLHQNNNTQPNSSATINNDYNTNSKHGKTQQIASPSPSSAAVTSSQDIIIDEVSSPPSKRQCKVESDTIVPNKLRQTANQDLSNVITGLQKSTSNRSQMGFCKAGILPKMEMPEYFSDDDGKDDIAANFYSADGGMEIIPQISPYNDVKEMSQELLTPSIGGGGDMSNRKLHSLDPRPCEECGRVYSNLSNLRQHMKLIHYPTYVQCPICKKPFKTDLYLRRHLVSAHEAGGFGAGARHKTGVGNNNNSNSFIGHHNFRDSNVCIRSSANNMKYELKSTS